MFSNPTMHSFASPQFISRRMSTVGPFVDSDHYFDEFQQPLNSEQYFNYSNVSNFPFDSPMPLQLHRNTSQVQASQAMPAPPAPTQNVHTQQYPTSTLRPSDLDPLFDNNGIYDFFYDSNSTTTYRPPSEFPFPNYYNQNSNNNSRASPLSITPQYSNMYPAATKRPMDNSMTINYSLQHATRTFHSNTQHAGYNQSRNTFHSVNSYANPNMSYQTYNQNSQYNNPSPMVNSIPTFAQSIPYESDLTDDQKASIPNSFVWENYIESVNNPIETPEEWSEGEDGSSSTYEISPDDATLICAPASESDDVTSKKRRRGRISTKESNQPKKTAKISHKSKTTIKKEESTTTKKSSSTHKITSTLLKSYPADSLNIIVVGTYTRAERVARIARYRVKRSQRRWEKKILYNCRKSFADKRPRVGGRFVKMS